MLIVSSFSSDEGGIYLDSDVMVLGPIDELRKYPISMGTETDKGDKFCNAFILAAPKTTFMCLWLYAYREYAPIYYIPFLHWTTYSGKAPADIARTYPEIIHVEKNRFFWPNFAEKHLIYEGFYDWSNSYIVHLWSSSLTYADYIHAWENGVPKSPMDIPPGHKVQNSVQEIFRHICFDETVNHAKYGKPTTHLPRESQCIDVPGRSTKH